MVFTNFHFFPIPPVQVPVRVIPKAEAEGIREPEMPEPEPPGTTERPSGVGDEKHWKTRGFT